jgi:hypothetical protein
MTDRTGKDIESSIADWRDTPEWGGLVTLVAKVTASLAGRHPGVVTEAIVEAITDRYHLLPRETWHRERRRNHPERIRRLSHSIFRIIEDGGDKFPADLISASVLKAFIITLRDDGSATANGA